MSASTAYVLSCLIAWPVLTLAVAVKLNGLRRGPEFSTVATLAALASLAWPLALVVLFLVPRAGRHR